MILDNPTNAVGGSFIPRLHCGDVWLPNPTNAVGGSFIPGLTTATVHLSGALGQVGYEQSTNCVGGIQSRTALPSCRSSMKAPPTALVGLQVNVFVSSTFSAACQGNQSLALISKHIRGGFARRRLPALPLR